MIMRTVTDGSPTDMVEAGAGPSCSWMTLWEICSPLSVLYRTRCTEMQEKSTKPKIWVLCMRRDIHTRRRAWQTLHNGDALPRKASREIRSESTQQSGSNDHWMFTAASLVLWNNESPCSNVRWKKRRLCKWGLCKFLSLRNYCICSV